MLLHRVMTVYRTSMNDVYDTCLLFKRSLNPVYA